MSDHDSYSDFDWLDMAGLTGWLGAEHRSRWREEQSQSSILPPSQPACQL
jgi:hypothetical protein